MALKNKILGLSDEVNQKKDIIKVLNEENAKLME